jgi:isoamylase
VVGRHDGMAQFLAFTIAGLNASEGDLHVMLNMSHEGTDAPLPPVPDRDWYVAVDTSDSATTGILPNERQQPLSRLARCVSPRTVVIFENRIRGLDR